MKVKINKKDIIWSYLGTFMSIGANIIILPFVIFFLSDEMIGLWYVFSSIGAIATLFDFGFSVTFARNITYCWSGAKNLKKNDVEFTKNTEPDYYMMKIILQTCKIIYGIISIIALVLLLTIGTAYVSYITTDISGNQIFIAWVIYCVAVVLNLYYAYYSSFLRGIGAVDKVNINTIIAKTTQIVLMVVLLALGAGIIGACAAYLAYGTVFRVLGKRAFYTHNNLKDKLSAIKGQVKIQEVKETFFIVWHNAWRDGVNLLCNYLCNQASTIICSMYFTLAETGSYSIGTQIASAIAQVAGTLYNTYQPEIQSSYINNDKKNVNRLMSIVVVSFSYLFILGTVGVIFVGLPVLQFIKPTLSISIPVLLGLLIYQFILKLRNCYTTYFSCTNRIIYVRAFIVSAVLCVVLSFLAMGVFNLGLWGLIGAQILSQAVYNLWKWPSLAHREMNLGILEMVEIGTKECLTPLKKFFQKNE